MDDYLDLERRFKKFLKKLEEYRDLCSKLVNHPDTPERDSVLAKQERKMREKLTREYGELEANIHGMAGYVTALIANTNINIFLAALDPRLDKANFPKFLGLEFAIQCINKAIGSCRHARSVIIKGNQIIIKKGSIFEGFMELRKLLLQAREKIFIQDRYLSADIFDFIEELDKKVQMKIIVSNQYSGRYTLKAIYNKYRATLTILKLGKICPMNFIQEKLL